MDSTQKPIGREEAKRGPRASRVLGFLLSTAALFLALALVLAALGSSSLAAGLGRLFLGLFAWAAAYLPLWLALAALLAFLPRFRPALLFCLASSLLPFLLLAAFARLSVDPEPWFSSHPLLEALGLPALGITTFLLILFLGLLIARLALLLFPPAEPRLSEFGNRPGLSPLALTGPEGEEGSILAAGRSRTREARAAQAAPNSEAASVASGASGAEVTEAFSFKLPDLPPPPRLRSLGEEEQFPEPEDRRGEPVEADEDSRPTEPSPTELPPAGLAAAPLSAAAIAAAAAAKSAAAASVAAAAAGPAAASAAASASALGAASRPAGAGEEPVTLLFRSERGSTPRHEVAEPTSATAREAGAGGSGTGTRGAEGPARLELPGLKPIEFTSVPPSPAAHDAEEAEKQAALARILARKKKPLYAVPAEGILTQYPDGQYWIVDEKTRKSAEILRETLAEFNIEAEVTGISKGPVITMFEILPAPGVRLSKIANLADNIALRLAASSVRIVAPIPGKHAVGIEVPNERRSIVSLREIVENEAFRTAKMEIPVILGKDIAGGVQFIDLTQTPHLLIAGATGSGKSVCVNSIILSILFRRSPEEVRLLLIDPKIVELKLYNDIPHLLTPVITEPKRAFQALQYCICEMERRYSMLDRVGVRDVRSYNRKIKEKGLAQEKLPYIVVIIDEFADLMATTGKELESTLARLAAMSRAVGIHLVLATQRPSIDVITGLIKANIPSRIAFMVASKFDSRIIVDMVGAEKLLGRGDMLFASAWDPFPIRMQGTYVSEEEVERAVEFVKTLGEPEYIDEEIFIEDEEDEAEPNLFDDGDGDPLFEQALEIVLQQGKASASYIQRKLKIGYNRAARLVELMEERGIVGPAQGSKPRPLVRNPEVTGAHRAGESGVSARERRGEAEGSGRGCLLPGLETAPGEGLSTDYTESSGRGLAED